MLVLIMPVKKIVDYADHSGEREQHRYGKLDNGGQYIIRVDEVGGGIYRRMSITIYKYEEKLKVTVGYIGLQIIQRATPVVALVLMAIFL